ncbi:hypothetical protein HY640_03790 [Candidatus Woesearchaeota archaeon]|nr:hypothetical protein [Candidatus Woesearchaeota archaeon]
MLKTSLLLIFLLVMVTVPAHSEIPQASDIKVTLINQEPVPAEPGEHVILRFRIENLGSDPANDVRFSLVPNFPISIPESESAERNIGTLAGRQKDRVGAVVSYDVVVDPAAGEGKADVFVRYSYGSVDARTGPFNVSIRARQASVIISSAVMSPPEVLPGGSSNLTLMLVNTGKSLLKSVHVKLELSGSDLPFAPLGAAQEKSVGQLLPEEPFAMQFGLIALPEASAGVYKIPVKLSYSDQVGKNFTRDDIISMAIGGEPSVMLLVGDGVVLKESETGDLNVQIVNNGLVDLKLATIELEKSPDYEVLSPARVYIGDIDSDDFDTTTFKVYFRKNGVIRVPFTVSYRDSNNVEHVGRFVLEPRVFSSSEASDYGFEGRGYSGIIVAVIIVISGLFIYSRFFKKRQ